MDAVGKFCLGCGRTLAEIAGWVAMTDDQRLAVLRRLDRMRQAGPAQLQPTQ